MKEVKPVTNRNADDYFAVEEDGVLRCSCGRELEKMDEETYKCPGGYPIYRFSDGTIFLDKWGNIMLRKGQHPKQNGRRKNGK